MTKCSVLPRGFGTLPAGSAVRLKSRFALYSASGALDAPRRLAAVADLLAAVLADDFFGGDFDAPSADDFARVEDFARVDGFLPVDAPRLAVVVESALALRFEALFARVAALRGVVRFALDRAPARFAAMSTVLAKSMPERAQSAAPAPCEVIEEDTRPRAFGPFRPGRDRAGNCRGAWG
jgi:hypothetical protein